MDLGGVLVLLLAVLAAAAARRLLLDVVTVQEFQRGLKYRKGLFEQLLEPGQYWVYRPGTRIELVDMRRTLMPVAGQEVLTRDNGTIKLSLVADYQVIDPHLALTGVENYRAHLHSQLQLALRQVVGDMDVEQVLGGRSAIAAQVAALCETAAGGLGLKLNSLAVRDFMLPSDLKKAFADLVKAQREGLAVLERARGETAALRSLANAARMMQDQPMLLQLRWMQVLSQTSGHTVVLGAPVEAVMARSGQGAAPNPPTGGT